MHCIFAIITPKTQYFQSARNAILDILEETRKEQGCMQFELHTNKEKSQLFLYERWHDEAALRFHYQQPYTKKVFTEYVEWLEMPVEVTAMNAIGQ